MKKYKRLIEKGLQLKDALSSKELKLYSLLNEAVNELEEAVKQFKKDKTHIVRENMTIYEATQIGREFQGRLSKANLLLAKFVENFGNRYNTKYDLSLYLYVMCRFKLIGIKWGNINSSWYSGSNVHSLILEISNMVGLNDEEKLTFRFIVGSYKLACGEYNNISKVNPILLFQYLIMDMMSL